MAHSDDQASDRTDESVNVELLTNILRILCMLEKELNRIARRNYHNRNQYPEIFFQTESCLNALRSWITKYSAFCDVPVFSELMGVCLKEISDLIGPTDNCMSVTKIVQYGLCRGNPLWLPLEVAP